eukprot:COSAG05_NODE_181_length_14767_cov_9.554859_8_plen_52_part_00
MYPHSRAIGRSSCPGAERDVLQLRAAAAGIGSGRYYTGASCSYPPPAHTVR